MPETEAQKETIGRVMHAARRGVLETAAGRKVRSRKQAIAIALHEAGASRDEDAATNRRNLARTKRRERGASRQAATDGSRAALYAEATRRGIRGRSRMRKADLARALGR